MITHLKLKKVPPATTVALIQELLYRDGLRSALAGRDDVLLEPILRFLLKYITDPRFGNTVCDVASLIIGVYHNLDYICEILKHSHRHVLPCLWPVPRY